MANGEASLLYPGYYPPYGLTDPKAAPVSSLRLEALRDGFQDLQYLQMATKLVGAKAVRSIVGTITWYPYPVRLRCGLSVPQVRDLTGRLRGRPPEASHRYREGAGQQARPMSQAGPLRPPPPPAS